MSFLLSALAGLSLNQAVTYAVIAIAAIVILYILYRIAKSLLRVVLGIIANTVLGFIALFLLNYFFGFAIPFTLPVIISTALFGLAAVGTMVILKLSGVLIFVVLL